MTPHLLTNYILQVAHCVKAVALNMQRSVHSEINGVRFPAALAGLSPSLTLYPAYK